MRIASLLSLITGLLMLAASVALFVAGILDLQETQPLAEFEPLPEQAFASGDLRLKNEAWVKLTLSGYISSESVQEKNDGGERYRTRYHFPYSLEVDDISGANIVTQSGALEWSKYGARRVWDHRADSRGGELELHQSLEKFAAPASGMVRVRFHLQGDQRYGARIHDLKLHVYEIDAPMPAILWAGAGLMLLLGPGLIILGVVLYGMSRPAGADTASNGPRDLNAADQDAARDYRGWAVMTHLSALLAYTGIPFGHVIGPLVIWLLKRDTFAELDAHGKESLNFQISITIYGIICLLLSLLVIGLFLFFVLVCVHIVFTIVAAIKANDGLVYRYPFSLRLIK